MTVRGPNRPWSHEVPDGPWDAIVIGTGIGGMTTAAILAKVGRRVLVLEQHTIPGGFTQMFRRPGYRWDVGVHIVGEMTAARYPGRLLEALTDGRLQWEPVGDVYDEFNFPDGFTIQFPSTPDGFREALVDAFPSERKAIDDYLRLVKVAAGSMAKVLQNRALPKMVTFATQRRVAAAAAPHIEATTGSVLAGITDDPKLRSVLAAQWGYYGVPPSGSSFAMHALMVQHFLYGAYYPVGGAASIAPALLQTVADAGGWTAVRRTVEQITVTSGAVTGVRLDDGTEIAAPRVVSAAGAAETARMVGEVPSEDRYLTPGPAHVSLYLGFKGDIARHGAQRYCQWYYRSWDLETPAWDVKAGADIGPLPVLFCSHPSLKDPDHDPGDEMRHTGEAITFVPWESFTPWLGTQWQRRPDAYTDFKQALTDALLAEYLAHYPGLAGMVDHAELSTPLSTNHFARSAHGSIYGLSTEPARFVDPALEPKSEIKGLFLGGVDTSTPGVVGGLGGGVMSAIAADPLRAIRFVRPLMRRSPTI